MSDPIRILHVMTVPVSLGFLRGQVGFLKARGMEVHTLTSSGEELDRFGREEGVSTHAVEMTRRITPRRDLVALLAIQRVIREIRPSIVHSHTPKGGLLGMMAAALESVPVRIYQMRGLPLTTANGLKRRLLCFTERSACGLAHQVLANSHSMSRIAVEEGLCAEDRIKVLLSGSGNGVDARERFDPARFGAGAREAARGRLGIPRDATVIGFVGRVVRDKGIEELATAWGGLREDYPAAHMVLVGPAEPQDPVPPEVLRRLEHDPRVHLPGQMREIASVYSAMDIVVLPSYREGFPNVPLEAAAMSVPVVTTRVAGCVDAVVEGETGLLVEPRDPASLERAIRVYLEDEAIRLRHGRGGRERALREFRPERLWEALLDEYERLLETRGVLTAARVGT